MNSKRKKKLFFYREISLDVTNDDHSSGILCETASCVLFGSIGWLYLIPSFKELNEYDQLILIEQSWALLFLLTSAEMKKFLDQSNYLIFTSKFHS